MPYSIVWEFHIPPEKRTEFEAAYASDGLWATLFAKADGFIKLDLLRCTESDARYLTIDRWTSQRAFESFRAAFAPEYETLDNRLEGITTSETRLGAFTSAPGHRAPPQRPANKPATKPTSAARKPQQTAAPP